MPTQEERLETVEYGLKQYRTETIKAYQEMAMEITMMKGLTEDSIKRLMYLRGQMEHRFDTVDQRLSTMDQRLGAIEGILTQILARLPNS